MYIPRDRMYLMVRTRVAVLRGGPSSEHNVSLKTGQGVLSALDPSHYEASDIIIARNGEWYRNGFQLQPKTVVENSDVIFNALHGTYGEDGTLQRELDRYRVPYTGSGAFATAIAMNKLKTKERLCDLGVKLAPHRRVQHDPSNQYDRIADSISNEFGPIYVVKPVAGGSSINTVIAHGTFELARALKEIAETDADMLVEQYIKGREATCGVVEGFRGEKLYSLPVVEIVPPSERSFFDHDAKYTGVTEEICPARFRQTLKKDIERIAAAVHEILELSQYSRSDFIVASDGIYFLEVNTLPGLTPESLMPKALAAVGATYQEFIDHLITDALLRRR